MTCCTEKTTLGEGSQYDLVRHLEALANAAYPENGIEWASPSGHLLKERRGCVIPEDQPLDGSVYNIMVSAGQGNCEGRKIIVGVMVRTPSAKDPEYRSIATIKTFGNADETALLARLLQAEMEAIFLYGEASLLPALHEKLPKQWKHQRETSLQGDVLIGIDDTETGATIRIVHKETETVIDTKHFPATPGSEKGHLIAATLYAAEWTILISQQPKLTPVIENAELAENMGQWAARSIRELGLPVTIPAVTVTQPAERMKG